MVLKPIIRDIGGTTSQRFGYDLDTYELYVRSVRNGGNTIIGIMPSAPLLGAVLYGLFHFYNKFSSVILLFGTSVILCLVSFLIIYFWVKITENYINYRVFEKISTDKKLELNVLEKQNSENIAIGILIFILVFAVPALFPLGEYYLKTSDMDIFVIYIISLSVINVSVYGIWLYRRRKNTRRIILENYLSNNP
jgi:heme/copper-type cytochrome/quinol oxidase subunit 2